MILQIRGTNGSGKSTLARAFVAPDASPVDLATYEVPRKSGSRQRWVEGTVSILDGVSVAVIGSYKTACGGMDGIPTFELARRAIYRGAELAAHVLCEGVLASTVFGSWAAFGRKMDEAGYPFALAYLQTPVDVCLERIAARNGGKEIDERLVRDKVRAVAATREKAMAAGLQVYDLPLGDEEAALRAILRGEGDAHVAE